MKDPRTVTNKVRAKSVRRRSRIQMGSVPKGGPHRTKQKPQDDIKSMIHEFEICELELPEAGYKRYPNQSNGVFLWDRLWQKNMGNYILSLQIYDLPDGIRIQPFAQMCLADGTLFNVILQPSNGMDVEEIENFYNTTWKKLGCVG